MQSRTIGQKIIVGFTLLTVIGAVQGLISYRLLLPVDERAAFLKVDALPGVITILEINSRIRESAGLVHGHIFAPTEEKPVFDSSLNLQADRIDTLIAIYDKKIATTEDRELFNDFKKHRAENRDTWTEGLELSNMGRTGDSVAIYNQRIVPGVAQMDAALAKLVAFNRGNAVASSDLISGSVRNGKWTVLVGIGLSTLASLGLSAFIVIGINRDLRRLAKALDDGATQVASASAQVSAASQSLASGSNEQAASLEETSASLEEMASMTRRNAESATQANALSSQTRAAADTGAADMEEMRVAMDAIKHSSDGISKIIKTIDEIAFQTNILALNAAVEAARAGEAGMGFAVVADEVRSLAQRSANSAKETAGKIEEAIKKSEHGVQISSKVARSLSEIVDKARQVDTLVAEIANASKEQNQGISQVNAAVAQMDRVTQSNSANAEETASASEALSAQARSQKAAVNELLRMVGAESSGGAASAPMPSPGSARRNSPGIGREAQARAEVHAGGDAFSDF